MKKIRMGLSLVLAVCLVLSLGAAAYASTATFYVDGEEVGSVDFEGESRITPLDPPETEGYIFGGWYQDEAFTTPFKESTKLSGDTAIYARLLKEYTFEAENTQLTDLPEDDLTADFGEKIGYGYSSNVGGVQLIVAEGDSGCEASQGYFISSLYYNGAYLEFVIESDREVEDAELILRLSSEYYDMHLTCENFLVLVNGEALKFDDINLDGAITDMSSLLKRPFTDHDVGAIHLVEGENIIRLQVNNSEKQGATGTMNAIAPMIDCIYVAADAELTWSPFANGIEPAE